MILFHKNSFVYRNIFFQIIIEAFVYHIVNSVWYKPKPFVFNVNTTWHIYRVH